MLAGLSVDYYGRLERGNLAGASESVLEAVARALQLDDAERQHLLDLARSTSTSTARWPRRPKPAAGLRPAVSSILAGMTTIPAYVRTARMEILAANELCRALYGGVLDEDRLPLNLARYLFLDPHSRGFFVDWDHVADDQVGALRVQAGREPRDKALSDLIGELSTRSDEFVARWARQNVRLHRTARKRLHNRVVGEIELTGNALELPGDDLILIAYTAEVGSQAEDQLRLLASWAATQKPQRTMATLRRPHGNTTDPERSACSVHRSRLPPRETRCTMPDVSTLTLNNGVTLPALGLGVFQTPPDETRDAVTAALEAGYRHIDTAAAYGNERQVGEAIAASGVDRSEVFVETKIWISDYGYEATLHGFEKIRPQARRRPDRPADPASGAAVGVRVDTGGVPGVGDTARRREGPGDRGQQLHGRPPHHPAGEGIGGAGGEPDRGASRTFSSARCRLWAPSTASSPRRGRRSAASRSTATASTPAPCRTRSSARSRRRTASRRRR